MRFVRPPPENRQLFLARENSFDSHQLGLSAECDLVPGVVIEGLALRLDGGVQLPGALVDGEADPALHQVDQDVVLAVT